MSMTIADLSARIQGRYQRSAAQLLFRRHATIDTRVPLVSFTFDDFPRSALFAGGAILNRFGVAGTYYASFGLMGEEPPTGPAFHAADLEVVWRQGHELGCHTFSHCHSWDTSPIAFERSVVENQRALERLYPGTLFQTFSYPISPPRPHTKRSIGRYFACCRGGGQTLNVGRTDLNYVAAFFIEQSRHNPGDLLRLIEQNCRTPGWLVFATHDVDQNPTPYGCTPGLFETIVRSAVQSGARVVPVVQALKMLSASDLTLRAS